MDSNLIHHYQNRLLEERLKIRYLNLRDSITKYALEYCISDFEKVGLSENEIECIKNRSHTFLTYYKSFDTNQKENFPNIYKSN